MAKPSGRWKASCRKKLQEFLRAPALAWAGGDVRATAPGEGGTLLHWASVHHDLLGDSFDGIVEALLDAGLDINARDRAGRTFLLNVLPWCDAGAVRHYLDRGADPNLADHGGTTPLMETFGSEDYDPGPDSAEVLLKAGADPLARCKGGQSALDLAEMAAVACGDDSFLKLLQKYVRPERTGPARRPQTSKKEAADFVAKAERGRLPAVRRYLAKGIDVNARAAGGCTALVATASNGHADVVRELLQAGADPHLGTAEGVTALLAAGTVEVAELLLRAGADVNAGAGTVGTALAGAAVWGRLDLLTALLAAGADVNAADSNGLTALHRAAWKGQVAAVELLLRAGADPGLKDRRGKTPYHGACNEAVARALSPLPLPE